MARPEDYPGGAGQFYEDLHSSDDARQKQAADHQLANDFYPRRFQDGLSAPEQKRTVTPGSKNTGINGGNSDKSIRESSLGRLLAGGATFVIVGLIVLVVVVWLLGYAIKVMVAHQQH